MKIAEVAERVGYRSEAAFIRRFSTCFGITPGELRKRVRRSNPVEGVSTSEPASLQHH
jgi:AraC-like DNA-binding protein